MPCTTDPGTLVSILVAARKAGFRGLERNARRALQEQHGIKVTFPRCAEAIRNSKRHESEAADASVS